MFDTIRADLGRVNDVDRHKRRGLFYLLHIALLPAIWAVVIFRLSHFFHRVGLRPISRLLYVLNFLMCGADICPGAQIGPGLLIAHPNGVVIAGAVIIGRNASLFHQISIGPSLMFEGDAEDAPLRMGDGVWVFAGSRILGSIEIGDGVMVGTNSVVLKSIPANAIVAGNPAKIIRFRNETAGAPSIGASAISGAGALPPVGDDQ